MGRVGDESYPRPRSAVFSSPFLASLEPPPRRANGQARTKCLCLRCYRPSSGRRGSGARDPCAVQVERGGVGPGARPAGRPNAPSQRQATPGQYGPCGGTLYKGSAASVARHCTIIRRAPGTGTRARQIRTAGIPTDQFATNRGRQCLSQRISTGRRVKWLLSLPPLPPPLGIFIDKRTRPSDSMWSTVSASGCSHPTKSQTSWEKIGDQSHMG